MSLEEDGPTSPKQRKLMSDDVRSGDKDEDLSSAGTQVYELDEVEDILEQDTQPCDTENRTNDSKFKENLELRENSGTPEVVQEAETRIEKRPAILNKITSVFRDAELISGIVTGVDVQVVYEKLRARRKDPNRVDIVTNEVLENMTKMNSENEKAGGTVNGTKSSILEDFVAVIDKTMMNLPTLPLTAEEINNLLKIHKDRVDRVDHVVSQILVKHYRRRDHQKEDLVEDMMKILSYMPGADPEVVYVVLEENQRSVDRVEKVTDILKHKELDGSTSLKKDDSFVTNPALHSDPLYKDVRIISKVVPHKDRNEIYAFLEAHHDKKNRIKVVIEEMMKDYDSQNQFENGEFPQNIKHPSGLPKNIQEEVDELREIFPDCDPNYLYDQLEKHQNDRERLRTITMEMFDKGDYPKLRDMKAKQEKEEKEDAIKKLKNLTFDMQDFLAKFPNPFETFGNEEKVMSDNYKKHALIQLLIDFPNMKKDYLKQRLESCNHHYYSTRKEIEIANDPAVVSLYSKRFRDSPRIPGKETEMPDIPDEFFYHEKMYIEQKKEIEDYLDEQKMLKKLRLENARIHGELLECECCYDNECLIEDMSACADGHLFCKECIKRSSEVVIGQGKTDFPCITGTCDHKFPLVVLQNVLPSSMFSIILRRMQEEEIKMADIPDLVSCPFCSFATIMPNDHDKVFKCLNPECLKESCRLCKELNHIPLRCNEVEKRGETDMRTYIEKRLTEAMLRKCHRCNKYFVKEEGCNKMTCTCGATSCYVCRAQDIDYDHFNNEEGRENCNMVNDMNKLHREEMEKAAFEAKRQYLEDHPEASDMELKYDPLKHIENFDGLLGVNGYDEEEEGEEEEEEEEEDEDDYYDGSD